MDAYGRPWRVERPLGRVGRVEVSRYETATGVRLHLKAEDGQQEAFLDPLELEALTRARYKPVPSLAIAPGDGAEQAAEAWRAWGDRADWLQNEFALVAVALAGSDGLLVRDMNAGLVVVLSPAELEALLGVRHMDLAPLVDTSDLVALPEPDIDEE
ncbi:MAG: hypothetical protein RMM30_09850 [Armatimonadota bacterium]|nr:hypothetical protein [Armatimonadota bacterium]MDW8156872.1 hypothetical protein [Armatimonadota bacterium]